MGDRMPTCTAAFIYPFKPYAQGCSVDEHSPTRRRNVHRNRMSPGQGDAPLTSRGSRDTVSRTLGSSRTGTKKMFITIFYTTLEKVFKYCDEHKNTIFFLELKNLTWQASSRLSARFADQGGGAVVGPALGYHSAPPLVIPLAGAP